MIGKITFLANTTPIIEGIPKIIPVLKSISLSLKLTIQPNNAVKPTNNKEYVVASTILTLNKYTKIGKVNMDPPAPKKESTAPIKKEASNPVINIICNNF